MTLVDGALFLLIVLLAYYMNRIWKVLKFIVAHVQIVSKRDQKDPKMTRIKQLFNVPDPDEEGDGK
jgi:hypothetical protein